MPVLARVGEANVPAGRFVDDVGDHQDLRIAGLEVLRGDVDLERAEAAPEGDVLLRGEALVSERDDSRSWKRSSMALNVRSSRGSDRSISVTSAPSGAGLSATRMVVFLGARWGVQAPEIRVEKAGEGHGDGRGVEGGAIDTASGEEADRAFAVLGIGAAEDGVVSSAEFHAVSNEGGYRRRQFASASGGPAYAAFAIGDGAPGAAVERRADFDDAAFEPDAEMGAGHRSERSLGAVDGASASLGIAEGLSGNAGSGFDAADLDRVTQEIANADLGGFEFHGVSRADG